MQWSWLRPRFGLRALLVVVLVAAIGAWFYANRPAQLRAQRNYQARLRIDPYELEMAGAHSPDGVPPELVAILGDSRLKHWLDIGAVKLVVGDQLITGSRDGRICIWNIHTGRQLQDLPGGRFTVSGDRKWAYFANPDGTVRCWDVALAKTTKTIGEAATVDGMGLAADLHGNTLAVETSPQTPAREITIWDVTTGQIRHRFRPPKPGGGGLGLSSDGQLFTWENDLQIQVARSDSGEIVHRLGPIREEGDEVSRYRPAQVTFTGDDTKMFVGSASLTLTVFDVATEKAAANIGPARGSVHQFALGRGSKMVALGGQDSLMVWHQWSDDWRPWEGAETPEGLRYVDWRQSVIAAGTPRGVALWNDSFNLLPWRLEGGPTMAIRRLAFHPDGRHLVTGDADGEVAVWEVGSWKMLQRWQAHGRPIKSLVIAASGTRMLTAAADEVAVVWNPLTGQEICSIRGMQARGFVGLSPDGQAVISTPRNKLFADEIEVSDAGTGESLQMVKPVQFGIQTPPAWTADGSRVAFIDQTGSLNIFDTKTWQRIAALGKTKYAQPDVTAAWFADNRRLITTGWGMAEIHLLDIASAAPVLTLSTGGGRAKFVALHPSEEWFAVCGESMPVQL